jgi:glutamate racemase
MQKMDKINIGLFDSGIGGFSILHELFKTNPLANYYYYSDDAFAPYGPKSDEEITKRAYVITDELLKKEIDLIVIACNTATASSIDQLRSRYPNMPFVGVEPYLNAYYKMPEGEKKVMVLTTESTGKSERFLGLKKRLDPKGQIDHYSLKNLARLIEEFYYHPENKKQFEEDLHHEMDFLIQKKYTHTILGCTHYPLVADRISDILKTKTIAPCPYIASRVVELTKELKGIRTNKEIINQFYFYSSKTNQWNERNRKDLLKPFLN